MDNSLHTSAMVWQEVPALEGLDLCSPWHWAAGCQSRVVPGLACGDRQLVPTDFVSWQC